MGFETEPCPSLVSLQALIAMAPRRTRQTGVLSFECGWVPSVVQAGVRSSFEPMLATPYRNATCHHGHRFAAQQRHCVVLARTSIQTPRVRAGGHSPSLAIYQAPRRLHQPFHAPRGPTMPVRRRDLDPSASRHSTTTRSEPHSRCVSRLASRPRFRSPTLGWMTYRTRTDRRLTLVIDLREYGVPSTYNILVMVINVLGNDTSRVSTLEVI